MTRTLLILAASVAVVPSPLSAQHAWSVLERGVGSQHAEERATAVHALGLLLDDPTAQRLAEHALGDDSRKVRVAAAEALGDMRAASSAPRLRAALADAEPRVVLAATDSLYLLGDLTAYEAYGALLLDDDDSGHSLAGTLMKSLKYPTDLAKDGFEAGIGFMPFASLGYKVFKRMHPPNHTPSRRIAAALKLARDPDPRAATALATFCVDKDWRVRVAAVDAIAERDDPTLLTGVIPLVEDKNDTVKYEAAAAVVRLNARRAALQAQ